MKAPVIIIKVTNFLTIFSSICSLLAQATSMPQLNGIADSSHHPGQMMLRMLLLQKIPPAYDELMREIRKYPQSARRMAYH
jgi:hypothetical protein